MNSYWLNFPVADIDQTIRFYEGIGMNYSGGGAADGRVAFKIGDQVLMFFQKDAIARNIGRELTDGHTANETIVSFDAKTNEEVDEIAGKINDLGGKLLNEPHERMGYYGIMFQDPDGHLFNIIVM
ncbi:VOC family protein [Macrococcus brunensis]|uniref:VOC family protein n=1 Tax=Macrococcus brunensis TaxID=198483 RepID=UPI001EF110D0|nr:VOC family protein [Macrococcus brunensis]ULG72321.1 VOC family protein [Macrococcus brunensis]